MWKSQFIFNLHVIFINFLSGINSQWSKRKRREENGKIFSPPFNICWNNIRKPSKNRSSSVLLPQPEQKNNKSTSGWKSREQPQIEITLMCTHRSTFHSRSFHGKKADSIVATGWVAKWRRRKKALQRTKKILSWWCL